MPKMLARFAPCANQLTENTISATAMDAVSKVVCRAIVEAVGNLKRSCGKLQNASISSARLPISSQAARNGGFCARDE